MKKRYALSMMAAFPLLFLFGFLYLASHRSWEIFGGLTVVQFVLYGLLSMAGGLLFYRPVARFEAGRGNEDEVRHSVNTLAGRSSLWVMSIGLFYVSMTVLIMLTTPGSFGKTEVYSIESLPLDLILKFIPSLLFVHAVFPAFIIYFLINDFMLDLKARLFSSHGLLFKPGSRRLGFVLLAAFIVLSFIPSLLVILDIISVTRSAESYARFTSQNPVETMLVDRLVVFTGMVIAVVLISRSFTRPVYSLLGSMQKAGQGDVTATAPVISNDEIGVLTAGFNEMLHGLQERELIRATFGRYVAPDVAELVLRDRQALQGQVRTATVLVTDIAGYTSISENMKPEEIVEMLNEYFTLVVGIIQKNGGTVNKFIGDAVFALFNVPLDDPDHAAAAIRAATEIAEQTRRLAFGAKKLNLPTRIGLNTGEVVAGNLGSDSRMEYTVIGDAVNIAARLEQLNKEYGTSVLAGELTRHLAADEFHFDELGEVLLKGKEKPVKVYTVRP